MKVAFLHLSDIHFIDHDSYSKARAHKIIEAIHAFGNIDDIIIIISGDIANSGKVNEYKVAAEFLEDLVWKYKEMYKTNNRPRFLIVPGNHDVCWDDLNYQKLQDMHKNGITEDVLKIELSKQINFFRFARAYGSSSHFDRFICQITIPIGKYNLEVNLINSALFSMRDSDKGLHYLPQHVFDNLDRPTGADIAVSVMHHSLHWFIDEQKKQLERSIFKKSSIVFCGHEHDIQTQEISIESTPNVLVFQGGVLANKNDWSNSQFNAAIFDFKTCEIVKSAFIWRQEKGRGVYVSDKERTLSVVAKPSCDAHFVLNDEYAKCFFEDKKNKMPSDYNEYFVFPRLKTQSAEYTDEKEHSSLESFLQMLDKQKHIYIIGGDNAGKTTFLKFLYAELSRKRATLFCKIDDIVSGNRKRITKRVFEEMYGEDQAGFAQFMQLPKEEKAIIIDDVHRIDRNRFVDFVAEIENDFGYVILGSGDVYQFNLIEKIKEEIKGGYARYSLQPLYSDKRYELIKKLVKLYAAPATNKDQLAHVIAESLKRQKTLICFTPNIVIQYTQYYCKNEAEASRNDSGIFGKVFEANITNTVLPFLNRMSVDKLFIILDKIAYEIHATKRYPLPEIALYKVVEEYNKEYNEDYEGKISAKSVIDTATASGILVGCQEGCSYRFANKSHLAYFIAREIKRQYNETGNLCDLNNILNNACFGINGDILILLTYITDNLNMLRSIIDSVLAYVSEWTEFSLERSDDAPGRVSFIANGLLQSVTIPDLKMKKEREQEELEQERAYIENNELVPTDVYDYDEADVDLLANQILRAISLMSIISRCLPNFEHMMPAQIKREFVAAIYQMPNKIFYKWANQVDQCKEEVVKEIKKLYELAYMDHPETKRKSDEDIMRLLQSEAICVYLNLMNIAVIHSAKNNTFPYLSGFSYDVATTYGLQHLMILERKGDISAFTQQAMEIDMTSNDYATRNLVRRIVQHCILTSKQMEQPEMQRLAQFFFQDKEYHRHLLVQRNRLSQK